MQQRRSRSRVTVIVPILALMATVLGVASSATAADTSAVITDVATRNVTPAVADFDGCWDRTSMPVRNLRKVSEVTKNNRTTVKLTWEEPEDAGFLMTYRVSYFANWRPQKYLALETSDTSATVSGLWPGRTYTIYVQAVGDPEECTVGFQSPFDEGWGTPVGVEAKTAETNTYKKDSPWVVSLGDSFISGEGGRWAGNSDLLSGLRSGTDTGARAYFDDPNGEEIAGCHRSQAAMIHITVAKSMNFACSGAITSSTYDNRPDPNASGDDPEKWKPGVDRKVFPNVDLPVEGQEAIGQVEMLKRFAETHTVKMVVLSIGGNNFFFSDIVTTCVKGYLGFSKCSEDDRLAIYLTEEWQSKVRAEVKTAIQEIVWAMRDAGYDESQWTLVQTFYPKPIATSDVMRYDEDPLLAYRQQLGGCGFRNDDADWAVNEVLPTVNETVSEAALEAKAYFRGQLRLVQVDNSNAFKGRELCHENVKRVNSVNAEDRGGVKSWRSKSAPDKSEWMKDIDISNFSATEKNEGFHPGYWGQLALRNCLRQVWNNGTIVSGGSCVPVGGKNKYGEPNMSLTRLASLTHLR